VILSDFASQTVVLFLFAVQPATRQRKWLLLSINSSERTVWQARGPPEFESKFAVLFHPRNYQQPFSVLAKADGGSTLPRRSSIFGSAGHGWSPWPDWAWDVDAACSVRGSWLPALALS